MNDIMTDGEWSYLRQSAVDRMANGTETVAAEFIGAFNEMRGEP